MHNDWDSGSNCNHPESGIKLEGPWRPDQVERIRAFAERVRTEPYFVQPIRSEVDDSEDEA